MLVYRWEHKDLGVGPLCGFTGFGWSTTFKDHKAPSEFQVFRDFTKNLTLEMKTVGWQEYEFYPNYFFAWKSLDKLLDNLYDGVEYRLEAAGFVLMVYEVTEDFIQMKDGQVFFNKLKAIRVDK